MNVVDICPVGALTSRDFRFKARVWYLERTPSVCASCATGCNIEIYHREGRIFRFQPRANPEVNGYWMCDAGRLAARTLQGDDRLLTPLVRTESEFVTADWGLVVASVGERLRAIADERGAGGIGVLVSAEASNEEIAASLELATRVGATAVGVAWSPPDAFADALLVKADKNPNSRGLVDRGLVADGRGIDEVIAAIESGGVRALVAVRSDVTAWSSHPKVRAALERLEYLVVLDSVQRDVAQFADVVLPLARYPESEGSFTNHAGRVQRFERAVPPPGNARDGVRVLGELGAWASTANARASA
jgi:NADH-quinone oxidoreductase subunit G